MHVTLDERPTRLELHDGEARQIGVHTALFQADGGGLQVLQDGREFLYKDEGFSGKGRIGGVEVSCLTPEVQVECHLGYEPDEDDFNDMHLLRDRLGTRLPVPYGDDDLSP